MQKKKPGADTLITLSCLVGRSQRAALPISAPCAYVRGPKRCDGTRGNGPLTPTPIPALHAKPHDQISRHGGSLPCPGGRSRGRMAPLGKRRCLAGIPGSTPGMRHLHGTQDPRFATNTGDGPRAPCTEKYPPAACGASAAALRTALAPKRRQRSRFGGGDRGVQGDGGAG